MESLGKVYLLGLAALWLHAWSVLGSLPTGGQLECTVLVAQRETRLMAGKPGFELVTGCPQSHSDKPSRAVADPRLLMAHCRLWR